MKHNPFYKTYRLVDALDPFSELVANVVNTPSFLNAALNRLDLLIDAQHFDFTPEDILIVISAGNWALEDMETTLVPEKLPNRFSRLKLAGGNQQFVETFRSCSDKFHEKLLPLNLRANIYTDYYEPLSLKRIVKSIESNFNLMHADALTVCSQIFGFNNGNSLKRFEIIFRHALCIWQGVCSFVPDIKFFEWIKPVLDRTFESGVSFEELNKWKSPTAKAMAFDDVGIRKTYISDMVSLMNEQHKVIREWKNNDIKILPVFDEFYQQLLCFRSGKLFSVELCKHIVAQNLFLQLFHSAIIDNYQSVYGTVNSIKPIEPKEISSEELQYRWIEHLVKGSQIFLDESQRPVVREFQSMVGNSFEDFRLPFPLNMFA